MGQVSFSATVPVPIDRAFDYVADPGNARVVFRGMKELRKLTPGPLGEGSRLLAIRGPFDEEFSVTEFDPPQSYVLEGGIPRLKTLIGYHLSPRELETELRMTFAWSLRGPWRLIGPLFRRRMKKEYRETFERVTDSLAV